MKVRDLIRILEQYPPGARVILAEEMGASELESSNLGMAMMNYNEYKPYWEHHSPTYGWEFPNDYNRKTLFSEKVLVIS